LQEKPVAVFHLTSIKVGLKLAGEFQDFFLRKNKQTKQTPSLESASELYRPVFFLRKDILFIYRLFSQSVTLHGVDGYSLRHVVCLKFTDVSEERTLILRIE
jgi:hypothetical protein